MKFTALLNLRATPAVLLQKAVQFVPKHNPVAESDIKLLEDFLKSRPNILVLTGAGISTESGIPDYRSEGVGLYARSTNRPTQFPEFIKYPIIRQRYWARNYVGWQRWSNVEPNATHYALAKLEREGQIQGIVTQNVDQLHTKAGSKNVVELHGCGHTVICLACDYRIARHDFQDILSTCNSHMGTDHSDMIRPDGDVELVDEAVANFKVPPCPNCGGNLKPDIVFFGDNVPMERIMKITEMICRSDGLLVLGSSLQVFSGYRMVLQTKDCELPIAIVNIGPTRGDDKATIKISAKCGDVIPKLLKNSR